MRSLNSAQKMQQAHQTKLNAATKLVQKVVDCVRKGKNVNKTMKEMVEEIHLRQ